MSTRPICGDIGEGQREWEFEPLTAPRPIKEPTPAPTPTPIPTPTPEKVPA